MNIDDMTLDEIEELFASRALREQQMLRDIQAARATITDGEKGEHMKRFRSKYDKRIDSTAIVTAIRTREAAQQGELK